MNNLIKYSPEWYEQASVLAKSYPALEHFAFETQKRRGMPRSDLHFGDYIQISEDDFLEVLRNRGLDSDAAILVPEGRSNGYEGKINIQLQGQDWVVFFVERGQAEPMGRFPSYDDALKFVAHCLYQNALLLSAPYRDKHFPGAVIPDPGQPWPDGKVRY